MASAGKLILSPFVLTYGGFFIRFTEAMELGVLFLMFIRPLPHSAKLLCMVRAHEWYSALCRNIIVNYHHRILDYY